MSASDSDSMVNGAVGLMEIDSQWKLFGGQKFLANVEIAGVSAYQLESCICSRGIAQDYRLIDQYGNVREEWIFTSNWGVKTLDLHGQRGQGSNKLEYKIGIFGSKSFITDGGKKKLYMSVSEHSRAFEIEGMFFKHIDFQSKIHFRCRKQSVNQAVLIANLLFNLQLNPESSAHASVSAF